MFEYKVQLLEFLSKEGFTIQEEILFDGVWREVRSSNNDTKLRYIGIKNTKENYRFTFGAFSWGDTFKTWYSHAGKELLTPEEKAEKKLEKKAKDDLLAKTAEIIFGEGCEEATGTTYLSRKWPLDALPLPDFKHSWKKDTNHSFMLMVPMTDYTGKTWNVQSIQADGTKRNLSGKKIGLYLNVWGCPRLDPYLDVYICEGLSTAMTVAAAMKSRVISAFGIDNIPNIIEEFKKNKFIGNLIVVVDNDHEKKENAGELMKVKLQKKYKGVTVVIPSMDLLAKGMTDYNDVLMAQENPVDTLEIIREDISKQISAHTPSDEPTPLSEKEVDVILEEVATPKIRTKHDKNDIFVGDISSFDTGFHTEVLKGNSVIRLPDYSGLRLYFERTYNYKILGESKECFIWSGTHYEYFADVYIESFAQKNFFPMAKNNMVSEFLKLILRTNVTPISFFNNRSQRKINFKNGYYNIETQSLEAPSKEIGFRYVVPFDYDPHATSPQFDAFMGRVTSNDKDLEKLLLEYCGYAISGDAPWAQKCMILTGDGANGKSTFVNVIRAAFGSENTSSVSATKFSDGNALSLMDGKLMNVAEETPRKAFNDSDVFKNLVTGGIVAAKKLYKNLYEVRMTTKLMMLCNEIPSSFDSTHGFYRRLLIVPFKATFTDKDPGFDPHIEEKLMKELPGIANKILSAYVELRARGKFMIPDSSKYALDKYRLEGDPVALWSDEALEFHPVGNGHDRDIVTNPQMYESYASYCQKNGFRSMNNVHFGRQLGRIVPDFEKRKTFYTNSERRERALRAVTRANGTHFIRLGQDGVTVPGKVTVQAENLDEKF